MDFSLLHYLETAEGKWKVLLSLLKQIVFVPYFIGSGTNRIYSPERVIYLNRSAKSQDLPSNWIGSRFDTVLFVSYL